MDELVKAARSLSDPTRVRVLNLLMQRECCVCEVMDVLGISQANASRYCSALKEAGFLKMQKDGRWKRYSVDVETCSPPMRDLLEAVRKSSVADVVALDDLRRLISARRRSELAELDSSSQPQALAHNAS